MTFPSSPDRARVLQLEAELAALRRDLSACQARESAALEAAQLDALTGLPNRRLLDQRIGGDLLRAGVDPIHLALVFIDLDGFKGVNDRHGHPTGDAVLQQVAVRLRQALRQDDLACRIGGDEFVCVLFGVLGVDELKAIERKLVRAISRPCRVGPLTLTVQASIGSAVFPRDGPTMPQLLAHADRAMYRCKRRPSLHAVGGVSAGPAVWQAVEHQVERPVECPIEHPVPQPAGHAEASGPGRA